MEQSLLRILPFRTSSYARSIYSLGTLTLTAIPAEYYIPVEQYAAANYTTSQIDNALAQGWITQDQYDETMAYVV
jgi:hypothetical protein